MAPRTDLEPEFIRPSQARRFGIGKTLLYDLIATGQVKSHVIRRRGNIRGVRLVSVESLREFIQSQPS